ncbi:zinc finger protein swm-like [Amphibalanus amphitrite]|uniref:zinc finger protein swm-like n=1 Tax=Amphibalanus amphitrite TaxID=1232801 RepID=UPI001C90AD91|nr:zinc finger protein swm-like [Amphibalanus amphitrite]
MPLNDYMSEFGRVVNIQVSFGCDPSAALVTFDSSEEAEAALSSPKPVLGCAQISVRPHGDRAAFGGRQMALSGLKRTVANPDAARRKSELDSASQASHLPQNNGDTAPAYPDDSPAASQEQDSADDQPSASEVWQALPQSQQQEQTSAGLPTEETAEARRQNQEIAEARRQEIRRSQDLLAANVALEAKRKEKREAARRLAAELQRREADLLQRQLEQQRHLLARLDSPGLRPAERQALLGALRALQAASQSTRAGLTAALERGAAPRPAPAPAHRAPLRRAHPADGREAGTTDQPAAKLAAGLPQEVRSGRGYHDR